MNTYDLHNEIVPVTMTTLVRLLDMGAEATALYMFYVKTAIIQGTSSIHAKDIFAMKGTKLGKDRFYRAKAALITAGLIEAVKRRDPSGKVEGCYIRVHYLLDSQQTQENQSPDNRRVDLPEGGFPETNALDNKKKNTVNKKKMLEATVEKSTVPTPSKRQGKKITTKDATALLLAHLLEEKTGFETEHPSEARIKAHGLLIRHGIPESHTQAVLSAFCAYWLEGSNSGKPRFSGEKYFDLARRLATWASFEMKKNHQFYRNQQTDQILTA